MFLFAAFIAGLLGSVHCIGMCGGFVGLFSRAQGNSNFEKNHPGSFVHVLPYWLLSNTGRIGSYMIAGAIAGWLGGAATGIFKPAHVQNIGLILSGGFMVALGLYLAGWWQGLARIEKLGSGLWKRVQPTLSRLLTQRGWRKSLMIGIIWGWLPCGLVYSMLVWSMTIATPLGGASIMLAFGLGTLPMLIGLAALSENLDSLRQNKIVRQSFGALIIGFGLLTLLGVVHPFQVPLFSNPVMCETPLSG
jgi:sulfite exporter TauE/SafE